MPLRSHDPRRLLPSAMEERLIGWSIRAGGLALLACVAAAWASLLTWSQSDPSLTHAADGAATNALGAGGAIFADVLLNTLGFAGVFLLLAPDVLGARADARRARLHQPQKDQPLPARRAAARRRLRGAAAVGRLAVRAQLRRHRRRLGLQAHGDRSSTSSAPRAPCRSPALPTSSAALPCSATASASSATTSTVSSSAAGACRAAAARWFPNGSASTSPRPPWRSSRRAGDCTQADPQRPRYATDDNPSYGTRREPFLPGPAAFERPNHVVQAAFAQAIAARKGSAAAPPCMTTSRAAAMPTSTTAPTRKAAPSPAASRPPTSSARPEPSRKSSRCRSQSARRRRSRRRSAAQPVRRPRADARRRRLSAALAQPPAPPRRHQVRPRPSRRPCCAAPRACSKKCSPISPSRAKCARSSPAPSSRCSSSSPRAAPSPRASSPSPTTSPAR